MAHTISAKKRIRQAEKRRLANRYYGKTARNAIRKFRGLTEKKEAEEMIPKMYSHIDRILKLNIIHKNKAANLKSKLRKFVNNLG